MRCLDGLRGLLACYVMLSHTLPFAPLPAWLHWLFQHGGAAVDVFFILSGLVIVQSLDSYGYRARPFLIARVARIYPVFLVVFALAVAVQPLATGFERMAWIDADSPARYIWSGGWPANWRVFVVTHLTMTHGLFPNGVVPDVWVGFLGAAWSLSTEWQFYLLALLIGARLRLRGMAWAFLAVSVAAIAWQQEVPEAWQFSRAFLPNKAQYFALGVVSAIVVREGWKSYWPVFVSVLLLCAAQGGIDKLLPPLAWTLCLAIQSSILPLPLREGAGPDRVRSVTKRSILPLPLREGAGGRGPGRGSLAPSPQPPPARGGGIAFALPLSPPLRWVAAVLQSRSLVWLGAISYCMYLVNEPVQKLLGVALAMLAHGNATLFTALWIPGATILPILAAWWLHEWIELPAQRYGRDMALVNVQ